MPAREGWERFELLELPLHEADLSHFKTCMVCREVWHRSAMAMHEATHAAVALDLGLQVEFVAIDDKQEVEVTKLEASLYPLIKPGMKVPAMVTRLDPKSLRREPRKVLVAMAAPSCVLTGEPGVDMYSEVEACIATRQAKAQGHDPVGILDWAKETAEKLHVQKRIISLSEQLADTGWVDLK